MASVEAAVAAHYGTEGLEDTILRALAANGVDVAHLAADDLAPVDEFHLGGAEATAEILDRMEIGPHAELLDIGCGIGGPARFAARRTGARVTGLDLTPAFIALAGRFSAMTGLAEATRFVEGSALSMPFDKDSFEAAMLLHVGMNLADKPQLMREAARVLRPNGVFAVYDIMRIADGALSFPLPWAATSETSFAAKPEDYKAAAGAAGFTLVGERNRCAFALQTIVAGRAKAAAAEAAGAPPPLSPGVTMGADARSKMANLTAALESGLLAPVEMIFRLS